MLGITAEDYDQSKFGSKTSPDIQKFNQGILNKALSLSVEQYNDNDQRLVERCFTSLGEFSIAINEPKRILGYINSYIAIFSRLPKTKAAKILKNFVQFPGRIPHTENLQIELCRFLIDWCKTEKKNYLKLRIDLRLAQLFLHERQYQDAVSIIEELLQEVRKMDDKHMLVECELLQCKINFALENQNKAKAALTAARVAANAIFCSSQLLADIDFMNGVIFLDEGDYRTSYSYFYESFQAFHSTNDSRSKKTLIYLLLSKIMSNSSEDVTNFLNGKYGMLYSGPELLALRQLNAANTKKSLSEFREVIEKHQAIFGTDPVIEGRSKILYESLLEKNIFKVIKPYSRVQIQYISQRLGMDDHTIQIKLSELILDKQIQGTLDQGMGCLILFDEPKGDDLYNHSMDHLKNMDDVVTQLFEKSKNLQH